MVEIFSSVKRCINPSENFSSGRSSLVHFITYLTVKITIITTISIMKVAASGTMISTSRLLSPSSLDKNNNILVKGKIMINRKLNENHLEVEARLQFYESSARRGGVVRETVPRMGG